MVEMMENQSLEWSKPSKIEQKLLVITFIDRIMIHIIGKMIEMMENQSLEGSKPSKIEQKWIEIKI